MASAREKTRETSLDRAMSVRERERKRERERERERDQTAVQQSLQGLAMLYFSLWLLYTKLVHF